MPNLRLHDSSSSSSMAVGKKVVGKSRGFFRPLLVEVCGCLDDASVQVVVKKVQECHVRYRSLLRINLTLFSSSLSEDQIFGTSQHPPLVTAPMWAITANESYPVLHRFHAVSADDGAEKRFIDSAIRSRPLSQLALPEEKEKIELDTENAVRAFDEFMQFYFLPLSLTHNFLRLSNAPAPSFSSEDVSQIVIRQYIHEASRTCSFLIADLVARKAALIDPQWDVSEYEADLQKFCLNLDAIFITHCFVDIVSGASKLCDVRKNSKVKIYSGLLLEEAGTTYSHSLSPLLSFSTVALPSFSRESVIVELHLRTTLIALFVGTAWSSDAAPRADLYDFFDGEARSTTVEGKESEASKNESAILIAFRSLRLHFRERYFSLHDPQNRVTMFTSHGGYNHVTGQLDLHWGCYLGDLFREKHSKKVLNTLDSLEAYREGVMSAAPLPSPALFPAVRHKNIRTVYHCLSTCSGISSPAFLQGLPRSAPLQTASSFLLYFDCRDYEDYHALHIKGSIAVPMTFPGSDLKALRAELWLQCLILPGQPVAVICGDPSKKDVVKSRIETISPGNLVEVFTLEDLLGAEEGRCCLGGTADGENPKNVFFSAPCPSGSHTRLGSLLPSELEWVRCTTPLYRLDTAEKLIASEPKKTSIVIDVRSPPEFKNGSHRLSLPFTLSAICYLSVQDHVRYHSDNFNNSSSQSGALTTRQPGNCCPSTELSSVLLNSLKRKFSKAVTRDIAFARIIPSMSQSGIAKWKEVLFYCAAGYRSLIAISLFRRAFEASHEEPPPQLEKSGRALQNWEARKKLLDVVELYDVPGGALQIMTQRPDLWQVKDRSIICIS